MKKINETLLEVAKILPEAQANKVMVFIMGMQAQDYINSKQSDTKQPA